MSPSTFYFNVLLEHCIDNIIRGALVLRATIRQKVVSKNSPNFHEAKVLDTLQLFNHNKHILVHVIRERPSITYPKGSNISS